MPLRMNIKDWTELVTNKWLYKSLPSTFDQACHVCMMCVMSNYNCFLMDKLDHWEGVTSRKPFLFHICWIAETEFSTHILTSTCLMWKIFLQIIQGLNILPYPQNRYHFLWNFYLPNFMGNPELRLFEVLVHVNCLRYNLALSGFGASVML